MKKKWSLLLFCLIFSCVACFSNTDAEDTWIKVSSLSKIQGQWEGYVPLNIGQEELGLKFDFFMSFDIKKYTFDMNTLYQIDYTKAVSDMVEETNGSYTEEQIWEYIKNQLKEKYGDAFTYSEEAPYFISQASSNTDLTYGSYFKSKDLHVNKAGTKIKFVVGSEQLQQYGVKVEVILDRTSESKKKIDFSNVLIKYLFRLIY